jgi:cytochrome c oxidase subunit 2
MKTIFLCVLLSFLVIISGCRNKGTSGAPRIKVVMKKYQIDPPVIRVKAGVTTDLEVSTTDVEHGFDVPQLHIKEPVRPGEPAIVTLKAPAKGEYPVVCGIICGPHHDDMSAKLVVE